MSAAVVPLTGLDLAARREELIHDGATVLRGVLDSAWINALCAAVDEALARPTPLGHRFASEGGAFFSDLYLSAVFPAFRDFGHRSPVAGLVGALMGVSRLVLFTDELLVKEPGTSLETPWHHDLTYWPVDGEAACSAWIPLDPVRERSGALQFARGSHRGGRRFHPRDFDTGVDRVTRDDEESIHVVDAALDPADLVTIEADPGDCVVFDALTLHRASGNFSETTRRRAVVLRLVGPDVRYDPRPRTLPLIWAPRLAPGDPLGGELFPTLWTEERR
ncbi:MAG: phytanoyl-CoA dioxygenase family protein [Nannocystaceae bacterium]